MFLHKNIELFGLNSESEKMSIIFFLKTRGGFTIVAKNGLFDLVQSPIYILNLAVYIFTTFNKKMGLNNDLQFQGIIIITFLINLKSKVKS